MYFIKALEIRGNVAVYRGLLLQRDMCDFYGRSTLHVAGSLCSRPRLCCPRFYLLAALSPLIKYFPGTRRRRAALSFLFLLWLHIRSYDTDESYHLHPESYFRSSESPLTLNQDRRLL